MTILVTGAAGFAGSHVVKTLAGAGNIIGWTRATPPPEEIAPLATWQQVDLLDRDAVALRLTARSRTRFTTAPARLNVAHSWRDTVSPLSNNVAGHAHPARRAAPRGVELSRA